jgi:hypothetical protein
MVRIKFTACSRTPIVSPKFALMASNDAPKVSMGQRESSTEQPEDSLVDQWMVALTDVALK